jgi:uncharacterized membrane protein HdeD (DUF308 family)
MQRFAGLSGWALLVIGALVLIFGLLAAIEPGLTLIVRIVSILPGIALMLVGGTLRYYSKGGGSTTPPR